MMGGIYGPDICYLHVSWRDENSKFHEEMLTSDAATYDGITVDSGKGWIDFGKWSWCFNPQWDIRIDGRLGDTMEYFTEYWPRDPELVE